jgi:hypothetical protein
MSVDTAPLMSDPDGGQSTPDLQDGDRISDAEFYLARQRKLIHHEGTQERRAAERGGGANLELRKSGTDMVREFQILSGSVSLVPFVANDLL